ncbi:type I restriction modification DNA specificity domain protein [Leptospira borgpetersenii str. Brem 307]|uniref:Type I restriction modification DNA specificity domain protein n=2 Tax=Leptospira borgpetersenii TaxID=174 RepID=A0ABC9SL31_LEPBO|nr:type I restriction modification DNA specificity domain protein [Leptospira borgpetersenii str. Brem 307]EMN18436.1 type I restriction modification DNA specificity domain protein [Leptospira borgpetersenii str. Brem 328]
MSKSFMEKLLDGASVEWKALGEVIISNTGGGTPSKAKSEYWNGEIPWASVGDLSIDGHFIKKTRNHVTSEGLKDSSSNLISKGDVIVAVKISPGKMKIAGIDLAINQDLRGLKLKDEISAKFLNYYFQILILQGTGTIVKAITSKDLEKIQIPIPPLPVQVEIVRILDAFTELTAELTARKKQYNYYRDQLLSFEEGKVEWKMLGEVGEVRMCKRILKSQTASEGEIPFYKIGTFGKEPDAYIPRSLFEEYTAKYNYPKIGEILISASGTIGRTVVFDGEDAYFQDSNIVWIENNENFVLNKFLFYFYKVANLSISEGGTIQRLYNDNLRKLRVPIPTLTKQARIVAILDKFDALTSSISEGLPCEIELRQKQYEYYRELLLSFPKPDGTK